MSKDIKVGDLVEKVRSYHPAADAEVIRKAYEFSAKVHQGQKRASGEPYLIHPLAVASIISDLKLDESSIVAGLLDRKSTRLNSSHGYISYAVFCLKKKNRRHIR